VKSGDLIVLYTKRGVSKERVNKDGSTSHFYYWGLADPVWGLEDFVAVVVHIDQWQSTLGPPKLEKEVVDPESPKTETRRV
jgi:hypothetical protein